MRIGTLEAARNASIEDCTRDGKCSGCGECCTNLLPMSDKEVARIRRYIKKKGIGAEKKLPPLANAVIDMTCPFRNDRDRKCNIYDVRHEICRVFQCDRVKKEVWPAKDLLKMGKRIIIVREEFFGRGS